MIRSHFHSFYPRVKLPTSASLLKRISFSPAAKIHGRTSNTVLKNKASLREMFAKTIMKMSLELDSIALIYDSEPAMTYRELEDRSDLLATHLGKLWLIENGGNGYIKSNNDGDAVILYSASPNGLSDKMIVVLLAVCKLGLTFMAVDPTISAADLHRMLQVIDPCMIISDSKCPILDILIEENDYLHNPLVLLDKVWNSWTTAKNISSEILDVRLESWTTVPLELRTVAIFFTAGTSGHPRPVRICMRELYNLIHWKIKVLPADDEEVFSLTFSAWDVNFLPEVLLALFQNKPLVLFDKNDLENPIKLMNLIEKTKVTRLSLYPPAFKSLIDATLRAQQLKISSVKVWTVSGNTLLIPAARKFFRLFSDYHDILLLFMYGSVEVVGQASYELYEDMEDLERNMLDGVPSVGTSISNTKVLVVDERDKCVPMGVVGEIAFSGCCVCTGGYSGYPGGGFNKLGSDGVVETKSRKRLFRTGDIGKIVLDGAGIKRLYILDRSSNFITHRNDTINLKEMTQEISKTGLVQDSHVLVYNHGRHTCMVKDTVNLEAIKNAIQQKKNTFLIPRIFPVTSIPVLPTGRIDCQNIRQSYRYSMIDCESELWNSLDLLPENVSHVKVLCRAVALSAAVPLEYVIENFECSVWDIGVSDIDLISMYKYITRNRYPIGGEIKNTDIVNSKGLPEILEKMMVAKSMTKIANCFRCLSIESFTVTKMTIADTQEVLRILSQDFCYGDAARIEPGSLMSYWMSILENSRNTGSCIVAKSSKNKLVGAILNVPADAQIKMKKPPKEVLYSLELFQACKKVSKYREWRNSQKVLQTFFIALDHKALQPGQSIILIHSLLLNSVQAAKAHEFTAFAVEATNPLVQEVCTNLMHLNTLFEYEIQRFKAKDKSRPFIQESESKKLGVYYTVMNDDWINDTLNCLQY